MVLTSTIVPYMIPAMLGMVFDMRNNTVGKNIFLVEDTKNAKVIDKHLTTIEYKMVSDISDRNKFLGIDGALSFTSSSGRVNLEGMGQYVRQSSNFDKEVHLLVRVHYETSSQTLTSEIKPMPEWPEMVKNTGATDYIRTITYGGDLLACVRFKVSKEADKEVIKGAVKGELNSTSGSFSGSLKGSMEKIFEETSSMADIDMQYFATVPLSDDIPCTLEGLSELVQIFPEQTRAVNNGLGVPLTMELFSLEALDKDAKTFVRSQVLQDLLMNFEECLGDIKNAKQRLRDWIQTLPPNLPKEQNDKIGEFVTKLDLIERVFCQVIANLDLSADADVDQFKPAFEAYMDGREDVIPSMYVKDLSKLKKQILDSTPSLEGDFGGSHYTYWGSDTCPAESISVFSGVMSTTDSTSIGTAQFVCIPGDQQYPSGDTEEIDDYPQVQQVSFVSQKQGSDQKPKTVKCSNCRVPGKSTTTTLPAQTQCPSGWVKQYEGTLVSTDFQQVRGELVCLDTSQSFEDVPSGLEDLTVVTEVSPKCGEYPCGEEQSVNTALPCVVCSIVKKTTNPSDFLIL